MKKVKDHFLISRTKGWLFLCVSFIVFPSCERLPMEPAEEALQLIETDATINVNPGDVRQQVLFGGDVKLSLKGWADGNTQQVANRLFAEMGLNLLRIPIYAMRQASDPFYENLIAVMDASKIANPDVKFFASVANGDGDQNNNLHGAAKFPGWMKGCCSYNIYSLNLTGYANRIDNYIQMLDSNGHQIDYLGPFNEDPASASDYQKVFNQISHLGNTQRIGLETYSLQAAINGISNVESEFDITGSHFYDDNGTPKDQWDKKWDTLVSKANNPVWYTEATRYKSGDNIANLIDGLANIFPPIRGGVEQVIFYQATRRIVYFNGGVQPYKFSGFKNITTSSQGKSHVASSSTDEDVMIVVFADQDNAVAHVVNTSDQSKMVDLNLVGGYYSTADFHEKLWSEDDLEVSNTRTLAERTNNYSWTISMTPNSYYSVVIPLML